MTVTHAREGLHLDPRTKLLLLILVNFLVFAWVPSLYTWTAVVVGTCILLLARRYSVVLRTLLFYSVLYSLDFLMAFAPDSIRLVWSAIALPFFVFLPFFLFAMVFFATTSVGEAAAAFEKLRAPHGLTIPALVAFRFVPTIGREFRNIRNAMRLRGAIGRGNPFKLMEYLYVPLLFSLVKIGEELTVAALTRGLGLHKRRTHVVTQSIRMPDVIVVAIMVALLVLGRVNPGWMPV